MNLDRKSPSPVPPGARDSALSPVDGTHNLRIASPAALLPHTDESIAPHAPPRTPLKQGALLLAIYVALYGTMGLLVAAANALASEIDWPTFAPAREDTIRPSGDEGALTSIDAGLACAPA